MKILKLRRGLDEWTAQGPLVNVAAVDKVLAHVNDPLSEGGVLKAGGKAPKDLGLVLLRTHGYYNCYERDGRCL